MREIKFRAWDVARKEMFPDPVNDDLLVKFFREVNERGAHATVMQFTGLKDRKGCEIYEGDIILSDNMFVANKPLVVEYSNGGFLGKLISPEPAYIAQSIEGINNLTDQPCEVIGNVHENPELLSGTD